MKLQDSSPIVQKGSRLDVYWKGAGVEPMYKKFRSKVDLPASLKSNLTVEKVIDIFKLNAVGFGNWVTVEDRINYLSALVLALYDLEKVLGLSGKIGLKNTVSVTFGSRGKGKALAHFESNTFIINLTRYKEKSALDKETKFLLTGGVGSLAHEYGHALDYYFGMLVEPGATAALTGGRTTATAANLNTGAGAMRRLTSELLDAIIWKKTNTVHSAYYNRLSANFGGDYWFRRNEIFARAFEQYVSYKMFKKGLSNHFLHSPKYNHNQAYLTSAEMATIEPYFDRLLVLAKKHL